MLSIIIITKDEEVALPRLLKSIREQNYSDLEIIVSDANSRDKTRKIATSNHCQIVTGGPPSIGRNVGAKVACGDILLFLDADAVLPANFLKKTVAEFKKRKPATASVMFFPISYHPIDWLFYIFFIIWQQITQFNFPHAGGTCIFVDKEAFIKLGGFNENLFLGEDLDFVNRSKKIGGFRVLFKSYIWTDNRRILAEGRIMFGIKYLIGGLYRIFVGEQYHPLFKYKINGGFEVKENSKK